MSAVKPSLVINETFHVQTVMIANPTASAVRLAIGRTDIPTSDSADIILGPQSITQLAVSGRDFALTFDDPTVVGTLANPFRTAQISTYDKDEAVSAIGSVATVLSGGSNGPARPNYRDKERRPTIFPINFFSAGFTPPYGAFSQYGFAVTPGKYAILENLTFSITRVVAATTPGTCQMACQLTQNGGQTPLLTIRSINNNTVSHQIIGTLENLLLIPSTTFPGVTVNFPIQDSGTGGTFWFDIMGQYIEFDP